MGICSTYDVVVQQAVDIILSKNCLRERLVTIDQKEACGGGIRAVVAGPYSVGCKRRNLKRFTILPELLEVEACRRKTKAGRIMVPNPSVAARAVINPSGIIEITVPEEDSAGAAAKVYGMAAAVVKAEAAAVKVVGVDKGKEHTVLQLLASQVPD